MRLQFGVIVTLFSTPFEPSARGTIAFVEDEEDEEEARPSKKSYNSFGPA